MLFLLPDGVELKLLTAVVHIQLQVLLHILADDLARGQGCTRVARECLREVIGEKIYFDFKISVGCIGITLKRIEVTLIFLSAGINRRITSAISRAHRIFID